MFYYENWNLCRIFVITKGGNKPRQFFNHINTLAMLNDRKYHRENDDRLHNSGWNDYDWGNDWAEYNPNWAPATR